MSFDILQEDEDLTKIVEENKGKSWSVIYKEINQSGCIKRSKAACMSRWKTHLSCDLSEMRPDEEKILVENQQKGLSFTQIAKKMDRRTS